ncbi:MAG TPA: FYDLN acid domain-containing protein, partial [Rhodopila sp.]|nr:FYDLN acid domain-containing protein [Rhodopila sp.]
CHERFYDLNKSPAICPKCGAQQPPEKPRVPRSPRGTSGASLQPRQSPTAVTIEDDVEPVDATEGAADMDEPDSDDEADDDIGIDPDPARPVD